MSDIQHFLKEADFSPAVWGSYIDLAASLKGAKLAGREIPLLGGKNVALIFEKTSTRTRAAFEVALSDQGAGATYLDPKSSQIGHKESIADTARVLAEMYDAIEFRGDKHATVEELARYSRVPVINGLTDLWHPTQALADALTMYEWHAMSVEDSWNATSNAARGSSHDKIVTKPRFIPGFKQPSILAALRGISMAYVGDARYNTGNSFLINGALLGGDVRIIAPRQLAPAPQVQQLAEKIAKQTGALITITDDVNALEGVEFVHTDIWVSMGEAAAQWKERIELLRAYRVDAALLARTGRTDTKFMHCLPAFHNLQTKIGREINEGFGLDGIEVADEVFEGSASIVFAQAANRIHTIKAVLLRSLLKDGDGHSGLLRRVWTACSGHGEHGHGDSATVTKNTDNTEKDGQAAPAHSCSCGGSGHGHAAPAQKLSDAEIMTGAKHSAGFRIVRE